MAKPKTLNKYQILHKEDRIRRLKGILKDWRGSCPSKEAYKKQLKELENGA